MPLINLGNIKNKSSEILLSEKFLGTPRIEPGLPGEKPKRYLCAMPPLLLECKNMTRLVCMVVPMPASILFYLSEMKTLIKNGKFWLLSSYDIRDIAIFIVY